MEDPTTKTARVLSKRISHSGSISFIAVLISLTFHLIGMSYKSWIVNSCSNCNLSNPLYRTHISLRERCYLVPIGTLILSTINTTLIRSDSPANKIQTVICISNQYLMPNTNDDAKECLLEVANQSNTVCSLGTYNKQFCKCDYTAKSKAVVAMTVLAAMSLIVLVFFSHLVAFIKLPHVLRWLIPLCFSLLIFAIVCMIAALVVTRLKLDEDSNELYFQTSLHKAAFGNSTVFNAWQTSVKESTSNKYSSQLGPCFGMEVLALYFSLLALILYLLMFTDKRKPKKKQRK